MSRPVDVLELLAHHAHGIGNGKDAGTTFSPKACEHVESELMEVHAAVAELIDAAEETQADAFILGMEIPRLVAAITRVRGAA